MKQNKLFNSIFQKFFAVPVYMVYISKSVKLVLQKRFEVAGELWWGCPGNVYHSFTVCVTLRAQNPISIEFSTLPQNIQNFEIWNHQKTAASWLSIYSFKRLWTLSELWKSKGNTPQMVNDHFVASKIFSSLWESVLKPQEFGCIIEM